MTSSKATPSPRLGSKAPSLGLGVGLDTRGHLVQCGVHNSPLLTGSLGNSRLQNLTMKGGEERCPVSWGFLPFLSPTIAPRKGPSLGVKQELRTEQ